MTQHWGRNTILSVPKSSKYAESIFDLLDHLIKQEPNITTHAAESHIMFSQNMTIQWINSRWSSVDHLHNFLNKRMRTIYFFHVIADLVSEQDEAKNGI